MPCLSNGLDQWKMLRMIFLFVVICLHTSQSKFNLPPPPVPSCAPPPPPGVDSLKRYCAESKDFLPCGFNFDISSQRLEVSTPHSNTTRSAPTRVRTTLLSQLLVTSRPVPKTIYLHTRKTGQRKPARKTSGKNHKQVS